jgi:chemotaxis protein MotB
MVDEKKNSAAEEEGGGASWMVTFSDLSTLLLTFFVLLLSMSSMDERKLKSLFTNFTSSCGILLFKEFGEVYQPKEVLIDGISEKLKDSLVVRRADDPPEEYIPAEEEKFLNTFGGMLVIEHFKGGFKMVFGHQLLFPSGSSDILPEMKPILDKIARFIKYSNYQIYIDGHTDDIPLRSGRFASNEALSLERAYRIMDYLKNQDGVQYASIALAGYGPAHPLASNKTRAGRDRNRRVEIIFKNQKYF